MAYALRGFFRFIHMTIHIAYNRLGIVNSLLGLLGELPISDVDEDHQLVPSALQKIDEASLEVQSTLWWFNTEYATLSPDAQTKRIYLGNDIASCDSLTEYPRLAPRGQWLYNLDTGSYEFSCAVKIRLHRILPLEDCPVKARVLIAATAAHAFVVEQEGDQDKSQECLRRMAKAQVELQAEHIRNARANVFRRGSVQRVLQTIGRF